MASKLTLNINEELLEEIKQLAAQRNKSLNELVAEYFRVLIELKKKIEISPRFYRRLPEY